MLPTDTILFGVEAVQQVICVHFSQCYIFR